MLGVGFGNLKKSRTKSYKVTRKKVLHFIDVFILQAGMVGRRNEHEQEAKRTPRHDLQGCYLLHFMPEEL